MQIEDIQKDLNNIWNGWVIKEKLGKGSFGAVYRIEREEFGRVYESALKVIRIPTDDSEIHALINDGMDDNSIRTYLGSVVEDIVNEVALMYKLRGNTNIVSYEDHFAVEHVNSIGWNIYIRMELLIPLFDYVKNRKLTIRDVIRMGLDMCNALEVCQKYNIVHRDIKPENMFVSDLGVFKLGDFGIARTVERTSTNLSKKGTYTYMAPELYKGEECNSSVDIYSLGIVLYRFLNNNRTPFLPPYPQPLRIMDREKANVLRMSGKPIPKPCNADGRLAEIVLKACSYDPKDRYESATLMKQALESILYDDQEANLIYPDGDQVNRSHEFSSSIKRSDNSTTDDQTRLIRRDYPEVEEEIEEDDFQEESGSGKKIAAIVAIVALLCGAGAFGGVRYYQKSLEREVPVLTNMTLEEAQIKAAGDDESLLVEKSGEEYSDTVEKGAIISQDQEAGDIIKKGDVIQVVISKGALAEVPNVEGTKNSNAKEVVTKANLTYKVAEKKYSDKVAKGIVISQDPAAGATVEEFQTVSVVISKGIEQVTIPDLKGKTLAKAKEALKNAKLQFGSSSEEYSESVDKGNVISQSIAAKKTVDKNSKVNLVVSKGPEPEPEPEPEPTYSSSSSSSRKSSSRKKSSSKKKSSKKKSSGGDSISNWDLVN